MESLKDLVPPGDVWIVWLLQAALAAGLVMLIATALAGLVSRIPGVGPILSKILMSVAGQYEKYLAERVPKLAEQAVLAVEERYRRSDLPPEERAKRKLEDALKALQQMAPGLSREIAVRQIEAALTRIRASGLEQKAGKGE